MTKQEASRRYNIPTTILEEYEKWGLCHDDSDLERLSMIMTLHDLGFSNSEVETYMRLLLYGDHTEVQRLQMLNQRRACALDEIHFREAQLVRLDYLRHSINASKNGKKPKEGFYE